MAGPRTLPGLLVAALALAACGSPPAQAETWQVIVQPGGYKVARGGTGGGAGLVQGVGLTCERNVPMIALSLARAPARNPALLSLSDGKSIGKLGVVRNGATNVWAGPLRDPRVLALLARAASVEVALDGVRYGTVSLAGAADAMRGALSGCWAAGVAIAKTAPPPSVSTVPPATPVAAAGGAVGSSTALSLPLRFGTYVRAGKRCGADVNAQVFIDAGNGGAGDAQFEGSFIKSLRKTGTNTFAARETRTDEADTPFTATYTITDREHFTVRSQGEAARSFSYCPLVSLPLDQQQWPVSEHKVVPSLPVKPGYYHGNADDKSVCEYFCSYYLFTIDGIAIVNFGSGNLTESGSPVIGRQVLRQPRITQIGALTYTAKGRGNDEYEHYFEITSPTNFTEEDGESTIVFRPIDPAKIPARYMPRF